MTRPPLVVWLPASQKLAGGRRRGTAAYPPNTTTRIDEIVTPPNTADVTDLQALRRAVQTIGDTRVCTHSNGSLSTTASLHGTSPERPSRGSAA